MPETKGLSLEEMDVLFGVVDESTRRLDIEEHLGVNTETVSAAEKHWIRKENFIAIVPRFRAELVSNRKYDVIISVSFGRQSEMYSRLKPVNLM